MPVKKEKSTRKTTTAKKKTATKPKTKPAAPEDQESGTYTRLSEFKDKFVEMASDAGQSIEDAVKSALHARQNVVMARVKEEHRRQMDRLVEAGIFKSRSESAAFLISEGIKARADLFDMISSKTEKIENLRKELRDMVAGKLKGPR
jgi:Arc/MetJ-type ribon-helix-helix transcriptional regulator